MMWLPLKDHFSNGMALISGWLLLPGNYALPDLQLSAIIVSPPSKACWGMGSPSSQSPTCLTIVLGTGKTLLGCILTYLDHINIFLNLNAETAIMVYTNKKEIHNSHFSYGTLGQLNSTNILDLCRSYGYIYLHSQVF